MEEEKLRGADFKTTGAKPIIRGHGQGEKGISFELFLAGPGGGGRERKTSKQRQTRHPGPGSGKKHVGGRRERS